MEQNASSSGSLRSSRRPSQRFNEVVSQGPTAIPAREEVDAAILSALAPDGLPSRRSPEAHHHSVVHQQSVPSRLPGAIDDAANGTSTPRPAAVPAPIPDIGAPPVIISSQATTGAAVAQNGGTLHSRSEVVGDSIGSSAVTGGGGGGGGLLDWALWPLWGTIDALKWAGGTVNEVAVAPVIRLASPWGLAGSLLTTIKAYTPQRARDLARIAGNFGLNAAGVVAAPAGGKALHSAGRATSSFSMAVSSPAGRQFLVESATGLVKLAEAMDTPEAKSFIQQGAVVAARGMDALASRHAKIFVKDLADVVVRLVELANSREATTLAAEFTVNVAHALEVEHMAGIQRRREAATAADTASPGSTGGDIGSISGEAFAASVDGDGGAAHDTDRRVSGSGDNQEEDVSGETRVAGGPEQGPDAAGESEEQTLEDLVRQARLARARQERSKRGRGDRVCDRDEPGRTAAHTADNVRAADGGSGDHPSDINVDANSGDGAEGEGSTANGPGTDGISRASTGTRGTHSETTADGPGGYANNTSDPASDAFAVDTAAARSRLGTGGRGTESDGAESVDSAACLAMEYERDGKARLPRFRSADFTSVLRGPTLSLDMQLEAPNADSLDDTVARASRLSPEGAPCPRSPGGGTVGGGSGGAPEAKDASAGGGGQSARARAAAGWKQLVFAGFILLFAGDGLRHRWKSTFRGGEISSQQSSPTLTAAQSQQEGSGSGSAVGGSGGGAGDKYAYGAALLPPTCQDPASGVMMAVWATPSGPCLSPAFIPNDETGEGARWWQKEGDGRPACAASFRMCGRDASPGTGEL